MRRVWAVVRAAVGRDELALLVGLALVTTALWPLAGRVALLAPGLVITWLALPPRLPLVHRSAPETETRRNR